jgi:hypothetical protein
VNPEPIRDFGRGLVEEGQEPKKRGERYNPRISRIDNLLAAQEQAVDDFAAAIRAYKIADSNYRQAKAEAFLLHANGPGINGKAPTVEYIKSLVDQTCEEVRMLQRTAEADFETTREYLRALDRAISGEQSLLKFEGDIIF